ncbi:NAD(P)H-dependent glycerol-3-phosphate dehydrogenase [Pararhodospirillum oryzae]|uniref:Glycerol-3-phosphate dehydrogenase [NAD(P)+] n=1 Tax=Pararhodospirillum oryzae TaxID=478448 RepID=A0A512H8E5_9PROT|nr:NAD(P)H-dependent glycerol-3-phosphate dehydrogenase [Pararhodospirillum oryzae]GEO81698.1 glycerol-3-phosphate dehydrogenase [NAD(P)+] [Pararhodospirillum oryzae]
MDTVYSNLCVLGGGAWGTALAQTARRAGRSVMMWAREPEVAEAINTRHENTDFLPGVPLDPALRASASLGEALAGAEAVLVVCPAQALRAVLAAAGPVWPQGAPMVLCAKGIEQGSGLLMTEVAAAALPEVAQAVLSGPTFAHEVALGRPTAVTVAATDPDLAERVVATLGTKTFRPYAGTDPVGAEIGGAVKNVLAIACGIVEGLGLGDNARAALLTRGLAEIMRLGRARGADPATLAGLSGLGDLILTATSTQSRNFSLGLALGEGQALATLLDGRRSVAEGVHTARAVGALADRLGVEMPICQVVNALLEGTQDVSAAMDALLSRPLRTEID